MATLAVALLEALRSQGARCLFGIPGDFALPFFQVIEESQILPLVTLSHEPAVGFAADAAARVGGGIGVAAVTYGAGALNMVNAIAAAYAEKSPVVVVSGGPGRAETESGLLVHHQARELGSQGRIYAEVTCDGARLDDPRTAPAIIARVLRSARSYSRPVYLEIPRDLVHAPCEPVPTLPPLPVDADALATCADEVLQRIREARHPVLMVGVEVRRFGLEADVAELAARLKIPVVTSLLGRGLLSSAAVRPVGTYLGAAGDPVITELVESSDGLVLFGVILSDTNFGVSVQQIDRRHAVLALDGQVTLNHHIYPHLPLAELVQAMLARTSPPTTPLPTPAPESYSQGLVASAEPIHPSDIATAVNDLIARVGPIPIAADIGDCMFTAMDITPTDFTAPGYYATMGYGVPAGLGLQAATGRRPLILVGDGAFQMTGWELGNSPRYGWNPVVLVFNNASWEMLRAFQPESAFNSLNCWNFAALADALGGRGQIVQTKGELIAALTQAWEQPDRFQLLDIRMARGEMSPTLARYVQRVRAGRAAVTSPSSVRLHHDT